MKELKFSKNLVFVATLFLIAHGEIFAGSEVKFKLILDYVIVIPVTINGTGPHEFLLDTGTNTTVVSAEFAERLTLRPIDRIILRSINGSQIVARSRLDCLTVGSKSTNNLEVLISDLRETRSVKQEICGVLGQNFLSQFNYLIDYKRQRIEFEDGEELERELSGERLMIESHEGRTLISAQLPGGEKGSARFVVDSGISQLLLFPAALQKSGIVWDHRNRRVLQAKTGSGISLVEQRQLDNLKIGNEKYFDLQVISIGAEANHEDRIEDGLLPTNLFRGIYFNYRKNYLILNPKSNR